LPPGSHPRVIVLWDIDNTLLYTGGAGSLAMARAFEDLYGVADGFRGVEFSGRSDSAIFRDAALSQGVSRDAIATQRDEFIDAYVPHLRTALGEVSGGELMPGVADVLDALQQRQDVVQGLGTGNFRRAAELKIRHYRIDSYFPDCAGGFGDDAHERDALIAAGIARLTGGQRDGARVVVIGDTPHDVSAAKANDAIAIGVATGRNNVKELRDCGADHALDDLSDVERVVSLVCGDSRVTR
jgi:phosphoglycolate phosphatase-like HAD superfamily hydrolase